MRIGIFTDTYTPDINGVSVSIQQLENELIKNNHEVYIITSSSYRRIHQNGNVVTMPGISLKKLYGYSASGFYSWFGAQYIKKLNLDVIHAQTEYGMGIFARIIAKQLDLPLVYTYHTMIADYTHYVTKMTKGYFEKQVRGFLIKSSRLFADKCTELIVPSYKTCDAMISYGVTKKINVIPTGIDLSKFLSGNYSIEQVNQTKSLFDLKDTDFVAMFVGRIAPEKSIGEIIEALNIIKSENNLNVKLLIVGSGPSLDDLKKLVDQYELIDQVKFVGKVDYEQIPFYYRIADIFVSTSTTETQGLTFIEAMASKLPVICKFDKNLEEIIVDNENGFSINNVNELANKLVELSLLSKEEYSKYQDYALKCSKMFSSKIFYEKVMAVYENGIKNKKQELLTTKKNYQRKKSL